MNEILQFSNELPDINYYKDKFWNFRETKLIEFYKDQFIPVTLINSSDELLEEYFNEIYDGQAVSLDLEWCPYPGKSKNVIDIYQFSTLKWILLVLSDNNLVIE